MGNGKLVALGDSVAGGEGINYGFVWDGNSWQQKGHWAPIWANTSAALGANYQGCHQTDYAYSRLMAAYGYEVENMACTGATAMVGILNPQSATGGSMQLGGDCVDCTDPTSSNQKYDDHQADVVTLGIGANDIDFGGWVTKCYGEVAECNTTDNTDLLNSQLAGAKLDLRAVLRELDRRAGIAGKTVRVLVLNYYNPFPPGQVSSSCVDTGAGGLNGTYPFIGLTTAEKTWLGSGLGDLNANIATEVTYAQTHFSPGSGGHLDVSPVDISGAMQGHEYCTSDPWAYGPSINYPAPPASPGPGSNPAPFHPTPEGQNKIFQLLASALA